MRIGLSMTFLFMIETQFGQEFALEIGLKMCIAILLFYGTTVGSRSHWKRTEKVKISIKNCALKHSEEENGLLAPQDLTYCIKYCIWFSFSSIDDSLDYFSMLSCSARSITNLVAVSAFRIDSSFRSWFLEMKESKDTFRCILLKTFTSANSIRTSELSAFKVRKFDSFSLPWFSSAWSLVLL